MNTLRHLIDLVLSRRCTLILVATTLLAACAIPNGTVAITHVEVAPQSALNSIPGSKLYADLIGTTLKISISDTTDLGQQASEYRRMFVRSFLCSEPHDLEDLNRAKNPVVPWVFGEDARVLGNPPATIRLNAEGHLEPSDEDQTMEVIPGPYYVLLPVKSLPFIQRPRYDVGASPQDVCFYIQTGGVYFPRRSGIKRLSAEAINKALSPPLAYIFSPAILVTPELLSQIEDIEHQP